MKKDLTPKEKAIELVDKYITCMLEDNDLYGPLYCLAIDCALIAVDEILNYLTTSLDVQTSLIAINYYQEVKTEIENL